MKRNNKKGFTIVELVIVIAVIAILSAVLIPTFGTLITDANQSAAQQKARNAYTSYIQKYAQDADMLDENLVIEADGFYFTVTAGQLADVETDDVADLEYHEGYDELNGAKVYVQGECDELGGTDENKVCSVCGK